MRILGMCLVALGLVDLGASWIMQVDIYGEMGIIVPDAIYPFTPWIAVAVGTAIMRAGAND